MKKLKWILYCILSVAASLLFSACGATYTPTCTPEQLNAPTNLQPDWWNAVLDAEDSLDLSVQYPVSSCAPDFFEAYVWSGVEPAAPGMTARHNITNCCSSPNTVYIIHWDVPLEPGNTYFWRGYAGLETGSGDDVHGPPSEVASFFTGPVCPSGTTYLPVELINPLDDLVITDLAAPIVFAWDDPTPCLVDYGFEIQISLTADFADYLRFPMRQTAYSMDPAEIPVEECTRYYWRIKTDPSGRSLGEPYSETRSFIYTSANCPLLVESPAHAIALLNLNCRAGPGIFYEILATFTAGERAPIEGTNVDRTWWQILTAEQVRCWVWGEKVEVEGDTSGVPGVTVDPPAPTPIPVPCSSYTDAQSCNANPLCTWYAPIGGLGSCFNK